MKKIYRFLSRIILIVFSVIAFVPALIILIITDIKEEGMIRKCLEKANDAKFSNKKGTKGKQTASATYQFVAD
jgi:hypothetical protein